MADQGQLGILQRGVTAWNRWRADNPSIVPDLSGAELAGASLGGVNFDGANLEGANLSKSNLGALVEDHTPFFRAFGLPDGLKGYQFARFQNAILRSASLRQAVLSGADLRGADLTAANLAFAAIESYSILPGEALSYGLTFPANLSAAKLNGAVLYETTLRDVLLQSTSFVGAVIARTRFLEVDLGPAVDLVGAIHLAPASFDTETLEQTASGLVGQASTEVEEFFAAAGLADEYRAAFLRRLLGGKFYSCFVSHSSVDEAFCRKLCDQLKNHGVRAWYAPDDVQGGRQLHEQIKRAIRSHEKLLLILSEKSMSSNWVELEIREALRHERETGRRKLFPIAVTNFEVIRRWELIDADNGQDLAVKVREYFIPDFSRWQDQESFEGAFKRLLADLAGSDTGVPRARQAGTIDSSAAVRLWT